VGDKGLEALAGAGQAGHHRADRDRGGGGDFFVTEAFEFAEDDHFAELGRKCFDGGSKRFDVDLPREFGCRIERRGISQGRVVGEGFDVFVTAAFFEERVGRVSNDAKQPGKRIFAAKGLEVTEGAHGGFLDDIVGVGLIAQQPACDVVGGVEVRKNEPFEGGVAPVGHWWILVKVVPLWIDRARRHFIPGNFLREYRGGHLGQLPAEKRSCVYMLPQVFVLQE
jgi:hypothetical protein